MAAAAGTPALMSLPRLALVFDIGTVPPPHPTKKVLKSHLPLPPSYMQCWFGSDLSLAASGETAPMDSIRASDVWPGLISRVPET